MKKKHPRSSRKHVRREKARIRRQVFDKKKREEMISELVQKEKEKYEDK